MKLSVNDRFVDRTVEKFNEFSLTLSHNAIASQFGFAFYFDPDNERHKELTCVGHYHGVTVSENGETLITGIMVKQGFGRASAKEMTQFSGYSSPGTLEDCNIPPSVYPLQSNGLSLKNIAEKLLAPFKIEIVIDPAVSDRMNQSFDTTAGSEGQTVKDYLHELAAQKNIIISHDEMGRLLFTETKANSEPVLDLDFTKPSVPAISSRFNFDGQGMHSHIYVQKQAGIDGGNAGDHLIRNPYVVGIYRPKVITQTSGDDNDTALVAKRELANELRGITLTIETDRWIVNGKILRPNSIITVLDPEQYIYVKTRFFIESINYIGTTEKTTATLNCVLPEVYTNEVPKSIFEGINLFAKPHV